MAPRISWPAFYEYFMASFSYLPNLCVLGNLIFLILFIQPITFQGLSTKNFFKGSP